MFEDTKRLNQEERIQILKDTREVLYRALEKNAWNPQDYESVIKTIQRLELMLVGK